MSHIPQHRWADFWERVRRALAPGGRVFFVDNVRTSSVKKPENPPAGDPIVRRTLNDGRAYRIVKFYYTAEQLEAQLSSVGWNAELHETQRFFVFGGARPGGSSAPTS